VWNVLFQEEIVCTAYIAALYLHNLNFKDKVFLVGNPAMATELDKFGIRHIGVGVSVYIICFR
jgi:ribonucleotide monophosphatase NagD (HAD superfamily)